MASSVYDTCLMDSDKYLANATRSSGVPSDIVCLLKFDKIYAYNEAFSISEERVSTPFNFKEAKFATKGTSLKYHGTTISHEHRNYAITQTKHVRKLSTLEINSAIAADCLAERAGGAYISAVFLPAASFAFSAASQITNTNVMNFKILIKVMDPVIKGRAQDCASYHSTSIPR